MCRPHARRHRSWDSDRASPSGSFTVPMWMEGNAWDNRVSWAVLTEAFLGWEEISVCLERSIVLGEEPTTQRPHHPKIPPPRDHRHPKTLATHLQQQSNTFFFLFEPREGFL